MSGGGDDFDAFITALTRIEAQLPSQARIWLDSCGMMFLDEIQREIIRSQTVDTRRLLNSFTKASGDSVWVMGGSGVQLRLEVGTNVKYAKYANDGHHTIDPASGKTQRWVPGNWVNGRFEYNPASKTGMLLKLKWVPGSHYFDTAFAIYRAMFQRSISNKYERFMRQQFAAAGGGGGGPV